MVDVLDMRKCLAEGWRHASVRTAPAYKYDDPGSTPRTHVTKCQVLWCLLTTSVLGDRVSLRFIVQPAYPT